MSFILEVPQGYGYVLAVATSTVFVNTYHKIVVSGARKQSGIKYPTPYATQEQADRDPKALKFNLAQRAHGNFVENWTSFLVVLLVAGLHHPGPAYYAGAAWVVSRIAYAYGYVNYGASGRYVGYAASQVAKITLNTLAALTSYRLVQTV
ncbi:membrane-associated proteins in eicosanoid and glutathione metabolism [Xylaria intraflava]|nr:membrane-associated proteins in eicosanoid and glutathione metabolism [Xylaria intraflava]